jgi:hypothetical protein
MQANRLVCGVRTKQYCHRQACRYQLNPSGVSALLCANARLIAPCPTPMPPALQRLKTAFPIFLSDFPIELRKYPRGANMPWHLDEQMYAMPQWELIYTIDNCSDSRCGRRTPICAVLCCAEGGAGFEHGNAGA